MKTMLILAVHLVVTLVKLARPGGVRALIAETLVLMHPMMVSKWSFDDFRCEAHCRGLFELPAAASPGIPEGQKIAGIRWMAAALELEQCPSKMVPGSRDRRRIQVGGVVGHDTMISSVECRSTQFSSRAQACANATTCYSTDLCTPSTSTAASFTPSIPEGMESPQ
jgi:hypothetical protein